MNYDLKMKNIIHTLKQKELLLLHSCCGPCSTTVIERLSPYFKVTVFYYNPNIEPESEYQKRKKEQVRYLKTLSNVDFLDCEYDNERFTFATKGFENEKEGGARCKECFALRLEKTALVAKENKFNYFGTTLTVSPHKNSQIINEIGCFMESKYKINFLYADFKKEDGYKRSIELARRYNLYRQDYCGCRYTEIKK